MAFSYPSVYVVFVTGSSLSPSRPSRRKVEGRGSPGSSTAPVERPQRETTTLSLTERLRREFGVDVSESSDKEGRGKQGTDVNLIFDIGLHIRHQAALFTITSDVGYFL